MSTDIVIEVPGREWLTSNGRYHWADRSRRTAAVRRRAWAAALGCRGADGRRHRRPWFVGRVRVTATVQGRTAGRMDPANAYPTVKAVLDGLTDAGVWEDDDSGHVVGPDMRRGVPDSRIPTGSHRITITIEKEEL
ncbi:hypothetical protein [Actinomyces faecalis]|uniref:hypothetical protein n=1 Tax=Actinomyces faecalis TaxID=2722820 RepID=UPI0015571622|nr:hypothetical protein [Actinomyces faecalis]